MDQLDLPKRKEMTRKTFHKQIKISLVQNVPPYLSRIDKYLVNFKKSISNTATDLARQEPDQKSVGRTSKTFLFCRSSSSPQAVLFDLTFIIVAISNIN
jgi:hypothetical protein